jgi:endonuclease-3
MRTSVKKIMKILKKRYGRYYNPRSSKPYKTLIRAIISQRTKDETTDKVSKKLFKVASTPKKMASLGRPRIARIIRAANYYKTKSKRIHQISRMLVNDYRGKVPKTRKGLMELLGVGGKTADIVMLVSHKASVIPVDTHVAVISRRLGWTKEKSAEKIRKDLHTLFPKGDRRYVNILLVEFGKDICTKHKPKCYRCPIENMCPYPYKNLKSQK